MGFILLVREKGKNKRKDVENFPRTEKNRQRSKSGSWKRSATQRSAGP